MIPQSGMEVNGQLKDAAAVTPQMSAQTTVMSRQQVTWEKITWTRYDNMPVWEYSVWLHQQVRVHIRDADQSKDLLIFSHNRDSVLMKN